MTALFGFSVLPISWTGLLLIIFGVVLLVVDAHVVTHGALTLSGLISLGVGMVMLFHNAPAPYHTSLPLVLSITLVLGGFWAFALGKAVQVRRRPVTVGPQRVLGQEAVVRFPGRCTSKASCGTLTATTAATRSRRARRGRVDRRARTDGAVDQCVE